MDAWTCWAQTFSAERSTTTCTPWASRPPNLARFCFLAESARSFYPDWNTAADVTVAILRAEAGSDPHDKDLHDLVGELSTRSDAFRAKWAAHNVRRHGTGTKTFVHPVVGEVHLVYEGLEVTEDPGLQFLIYTAQPGTDAGERLALLGSWAASQAWAGPAPARSTSGSLASD